MPAKMVDRKAGRNPHDLTVDEICDGVVAFAERTRIGGGSVGDIDLYRLVQAYIRNPDMRKRWNDMMDKLERSS